MDEIMYDHSTYLICGIVMVTMVAALEGGYQIGRARETRSNDGAKSQLNAVQGSLLGLLALILGFTFSLSLQRFDDRSKAVIDEANAIGTALLRAEILHVDVRMDAGETLRDYLTLRARMGEVSVAESDERELLMTQATQAQERLWQEVHRALELDDRPVTSGLYLQSLNEMFDSYGRRDAALNRHVPEMVLFLLFLTFVMVSAIVGTTSGVSGTRPPAAMIIMVALIVILVFLIIDLDRPRRGLIEVDQSSMTQLVQSTLPSRSD